jgi:hypothetical protein
MTIPRYLLLQEHWRTHPRPEWLLAGYLRFKPTPKPIEARIATAGRARVAPPSGAMMGLFTSLGGKPGQTVVLST